MWVLAGREGEHMWMARVASPVRTAMVFETLAAQIKSGGAVELGVGDGVHGAPEQLVDHCQAHINSGIAI